MCKYKTPVNQDFHFDFDGVFVINKFQKNLTRRTI